MEKKKELEILSSPSRVCVVWYDGWKGGYCGYVKEAITHKRIDGVEVRRCGSVFEVYYALVDIFNDMYE